MYSHFVLARFTEVRVCLQVEKQEGMLRLMPDSLHYSARKAHFSVKNSSNYCRFYNIDRIVKNLGGKLLEEGDSMLSYGMA
jgi:hypothetical protein